MTARLRRTARVAAAGLVVAVLPVVAGSSAAAAGCTSEVRPNPLQAGCDDVTPPETVVLSTAPSPNAAGWIRADDVTFTVRGHHTDDDRDDIAFECLWSTPDAEDTSWSACGITTYDRAAGVATSTISFSDLADSNTGSYRLEVRAVDTPDQGILWTGGTIISPETEPADDKDASPATASVKVDTAAPNTIVHTNVYDEQTPHLPMMTTSEPTFSTFSSERDSTLRCTVDGAPARCNRGTTTLRRLGTGTKTLRVWAVDRAGNVDPTPAEAQFTMPRNLRAARGWRSFRVAGHYAGDYLEARPRGTELTVRGSSFHEVRLLAPRGPSLGKLQVKIPRRPWRTVNLRSSLPEPVAVFVLREAFENVLSGPIRIRVASSGKPVRVDAILVR